MADIYLLGEGGTVWGYDEPLSPQIANQVERGLLQRVNADGSTYIGDEDDADLVDGSGPEPSTGDGDGEEPGADPAGGGQDGDGQEASKNAGEAPAKPSQAAAKADWVAYAVSLGVPEADAQAMTKADLIAAYGH